MISIFRSERARSKGADRGRGWSSADRREQQRRGGLPRVQGVVPAQRGGRGASARHLATLHDKNNTEFAYKTLHDKNTRSLYIKH